RSIRALTASRSTWSRAHPTRLPCSSRKINLGRYGRRETSVPGESGARRWRRRRRCRPLSRRPSPSGARARPAREPETTAPVVGARVVEAAVGAVTARPPPANPGRAQQVSAELPAVQALGSAWLDAKRQVVRRKDPVFHQRRQRCPI